MAKILSSAVLRQIQAQDVKPVYSLFINGNPVGDRLYSYEVNFSREFGSASATFILNNNDSIFSENGVYPIKVGDIVELTCRFGNDNTIFPKFFGTVNQRSFSKTATERNVTLNCLDYVSNLQFLDIDYEVDGDKVAVEEETLTPNYLPAPNDSLAQIFNFANNAVAENPKPVLTIRAQDGTSDDPQFDGFEIEYASGQVKLGSPLNARYNYRLVAKSYSFYTRGVSIEDIIEDIITLPDGYGRYLYGEESAQAVIDNHLTETFFRVRGEYTDYLTPNFTDSEISIYTQLNGAISAGATSITVDDTSGFPSSGTAEINGDTFTWTSKDATHLYGIPASGTTALAAHPDNAYVKYTATYEPGRVWYLSYSNLITNLVSGQFTFPGSPTISYIDKRYGRVILATAISTASIPSCYADYSFKTIQATGVEINNISFRSRDTENRFEALARLKEFLAPNYSIRTIGDDKIWASYLTQKVTADYDLSLVTSANYLEDEDLYTRALFWGKNKNPTNIMFKDGVNFLTTGEAYKAIATQIELTYDREEGNYYVYKNALSGVGTILVNNLVPIVYINGVPIDNQIHEIPQAPVQVTVRTRTETETSGGGFGKEPEVEVRTYYDYDVKFAHSNIEPSQPIYIYDNVGNTVYTVAPNSNFSYATGAWTIGGGVRSTTIESFSTASYWVFYASEKLVIDYENVEFKIAKDLLPNQTSNTVTATFEYYTVLTPTAGINNIIDGRHDTQVQTEFFAEPPTGYNYAILDLGAVYNLQALDIVAGFYKPDNIRKYDVDMRLSVQYSLDNVTYNEIGDKTHNFSLISGESASFEEADLGVGFEARYLKLIIENVKKVEFRNGVWPVAISEINAYGDIILKAEAKLIPTTELVDAIDLTALQSSAYYPGTVRVISTYGFQVPESGETLTAYIGEDSFTYTGLTETMFTGVEGLSEDHAIGDRVSQELAGDNTVYDYEQLLPQLGDRVFKNTNIDDTFLYDQTTLNRIARAYLTEFVKNHSKRQIESLFAPYLQVGQTLSLTDPYVGEVAVNYFVESIVDRFGSCSIVLARYPS